MISGHGLVGALKMRVVKCSAQNFGLYRNLTMGPYFGPIFTIIFLVDCLFFALLEWWLPSEDIEKAGSTWNHEHYAEVSISANSIYI
jgi:hypothetical protein